MGRSRTPGQRAGLTRAAVLATARTLLVERGVEALTMRALAERLDVAPNALYSHVASKTALVDDLLDDLLADVTVPPADLADPQAGLFRLLTSTYDVLVAHAELVPLYLARQGASGPHARRLGDVMAGLLARVDVRGPAAREAVRVLVVYTIGFAAFTTRPPLEADGEQKLAPAELLDNFTLGLRWLLAGIIQRRGRATG